MSTKKCACFTPSGLVYTRLETDGTIARRPTDMQKENKPRVTRSTDNEVYQIETVESILQDNPSIGHLRFTNEYTNDTEDDNIRDKIDKLIEQTEAFIEFYERTKNNIDHKRIKRRAQHWHHHNKHKQKNEAILNDNDSSLECKIEKDGTVNCSQVIYNDLKAWHTNRLSLEDQIRELKTKLDDLKEIKRHLKISKPILVSVTDKEIVQPQLTNNQILNKTIARVHTPDDHHRKGRVGSRLRMKHRNNTSYYKKISQSNDYLIPTTNTQTKIGLFDEQFKNYTTDDTLVTMETTTFEDVLNASVFKQESPKPQVTTVITDNAYVDKLERFSTFHNLITLTVQNEDIYTTESSNVYEIPNPKRVSSEDLSQVDHSQPVDFSQRAHYFNSAIDKILGTEQSGVNVNATQSTNILAKTTTEKNGNVFTTAIPNLGPARLDASQFKKGNTNKVNNNIGVLDKPIDIFQRRLHPLYIENEDKHVCYCEEDRFVII